MAQSFLSPGVQTNEVDQSFLQAGAPQPAAIMIGRTAKGPAFYPVTVSNYSDFVSQFGDVDPTGRLASALPYAARNYLMNSTSLTVVRVLGSADGTTVNNGYNVGTIFGICDTSGSTNSTGSVLAVVHTSQPFVSMSLAGVAGDANRFVIKFGTVFATTASFLTSSDDYVGKSLNSDPTQYGTYGHYVYQIFGYQTQNVSASWSAVNSISSSFTAFNRDYDHGRSAFIKSQPVGGIEYDLFRFNTLGRGRATNDDIKIQIDNVKPSSVPNVYPYGTFDVLVRSFYDNDSRPVVLETWAGCTLDPNSPNFISRQIGDVDESFNTATRKFAINSGKYPNKSQYVRVEIPTNNNPPPTALPWGFRGYFKTLFSGSNAGTGGALGAAQVPPLQYVVNQFDTNGNYNGNIVWGVQFLSGGVVDRMRAMPDGAVNALAPLTASDPDFSLRFLSGTYINGSLRFAYNTATPVNYLPIFSSASLQTFTVPFWGGFDGWDLRVADPLYLNNTDGTSVIGVVASQRAVDCVANPDQVAGNTLALPGQTNIAVCDYARSLVNSRMDMYYVMDVTGATPNEVIANLNARQIDDNYSGCYYPDLWIKDQTSNNILRMPPSVGVMGALAYNDRVAQAFFAPAGMNRGGLGQFGVIDIVDRLDHQDRDQLYEARINPITKFPVEGIVIFGQKTLQLKQSSLTRVNVRRLLILAKGAVASVANTLLFEPNNPATWTRFVNKVNPILDAYRSAQGINRFKVVMDNTTNTPDKIDANEMYGKIFLEPVQAAEFVSIDFVITAAGVTFGS
jgi:hypothetical protein